MSKAVITSIWCNCKFWIAITVSRRGMEQYLLTDVEVVS